MKETHTLSLPLKTPLSPQAFALKFLELMGDVDEGTDAVRTEVERQQWIDCMEASRRSLSTITRKLERNEHHGKRRASTL
jgi:hypothetical protein